MNMQTNSTELKTETSTGYDSEDTKVITPDTATPDNTPDDNLDDFGYEKTEGDKATEKVKEEVKVEEKVEEKKIENPSTGYDEESVKESEKAKTEEPKTEDPKTEDKSEGDKTDEEKLKAEAEKLVVDLTETVKDLPEGYDKDKVLKFATDNKFSNEQMKAYVEMEKAANIDYNASQAETKAAQKRDFIADLKADATFGGENFARSVNRVEKLLENHMPNMKKTLTDRGGMMPPYLMKDLLALDKKLNPTTSLVSGEPSAPAEKDDGNFLDEMYE